LPEIYIIAGPNGAGKTTASFTILPEILGITQFINADEIAKGLSPFNTESVAIQAGKLMLSRIKYLIQHKSDFAFETMLSTKSYVNLIREAHQANYKITLVFFYLDSAQLAIERVKKRVLQGGHSIPEFIIRRRFLRGINNLKNLYIPIVDNWMVFDNSENELKFVAERSENKEVNIYNSSVWNKILAL
jgi:predicted ABC-type ATPase